MKTQIVALSLLLSLSGVVYGADEVPAGDDTTTQQEIQDIKTIDELIEKMNRTQHQNRYRYMNEIKDRISVQKGQYREEKMRKILAKITKKRKKTQSHMNEKSSQQRSSNMNNGSGGGMGGGGMF